MPPYIKAVGNPVKLYGLNSVGLQRNGFPEEVVRELKRAYRLFFRSELNVSQAMERARAGAAAVPRGEELLRFVEESERGVGRLSAPVRIGVVGAGGARLPSRPHPARHAGRGVRRLLRRATGARRSRSRASSA